MWYLDGLHIMKAVVRPLTGKNCQNSLIPQVERKIIAQLSHDFSPLISIKIPPACNTRQASEHNINCGTCEAAHTYYCF